MQAPKGIGPEERLQLFGGGCRLGWFFAHQLLSTVALPPVKHERLYKAVALEGDYRDGDAKVGTKERAA